MKSRLAAKRGSSNEEEEEEEACLSVLSVLEASPSEETEKESLFTSCVPFWVFFAEALEVLAKATGIDVSRFSFAGMKDRRSITTQWISCSNPLILPMDTPPRTPRFTSSSRCSSSAGEREDRDTRAAPPPSPGSACHEKRSRRGGKQEQRGQEEEEEEQRHSSTQRTEGHFVTFTEPQERGKEFELEEDPIKARSRVERRSSLSSPSSFSPTKERSRGSSSLSLPPMTPSSCSSSKDEEFARHGALRESSPPFLWNEPGHRPHPADTATSLSASRCPLSFSFSSGKKDEDDLRSATRKEEEGGKLLSGQNAEKSSSFSVLGERGELTSGPVLLTAEVARRAVRHPCWDSSCVRTAGSPFSFFLSLSVFSLMEMPEPDASSSFSSA